MVEFIQSVSGTHISRTIILGVSEGIFLLTSTYTDFLLVL